LGQKTIGLPVVEEVISDMDITKHVTAFPSSNYATPEEAGNGSSPRPRTLPFAPVREPRNTLALAEAKSYIEQLAGQLRDWKSSREGTGR
jgi:hypothetical protein